MTQTKHPGTKFLDIKGIYKNNINKVYPKGLVEIISVSYENNLCLGRHKKALRRKNSEVLYVVTRDYKVKYTYLNNAGKTAKSSVTVPAGLCTDLASVPDCFRWLYPRVGPYLEGAIVHDFLYVAWQLFNGGKPSSHYRAFADSLLLVLWREAGVSRFTRNVFYWLIRLGGSDAFESWEKKGELASKVDICSFNENPIEAYTGTVYPPKGSKISNADYKSNLCLGRFKKSLTVDDSESLYVVTKNYTVQYTHSNGKGGKVTVPAGFCTALTSVPRSWLGLWRFHRVGKHLEAAIVHDFLYVEWQLKNKKADDNHRIFANDLFFKLMEKAEVDEDVRDRFESVVNSSECIGKFHRGRENGDILVDNPCVSELQTGDKN